VKHGAGRLAVVAAGVIVIAGAAALAWHQLRPRAITVDYPRDGSLFPPEFPAPRLEWRDESPRATVWTIDVSFAGGAPPIHGVSRGEPIEIGAIDTRAVGPTNRPPELTPEQAAAHTWRPDAATWESIKKASTGQPAVVTITGYAGDTGGRAVSHGRVSLGTSSDPVGAPIFYRDVPLMPSEGEKGVIKPLDKKFTPLIAWRLRDVAQTESRVVMQGLHSCTNCHSVSQDGRTMGMDLDGPNNDKGIYALFPIRPQSAIRAENVIQWSTYRGKLGGKLRVAFMSKVSPDGRYVVTSIADPGKGQTDYQRKQAPEDLRQNYYVANFKDYRFLQVFYPTRGVLAWYSKEKGLLQPLPGADDPRYVQTGAVWSPDGGFLVFSRAEAKDAYPDGSTLAERANAPNETQIRYDLYRIPFDEGRGGVAEPIAGASANGMSNSFPKVSPDGKWIVFVQARNGQLMRPDGKLFIVPAQGGQARLMRCNTPLMNSWHSFSPNGRWLVFSSKSRSPYTQMFLTHIDEQGNDTPAILIENATAANRAVNIPEFVNIPPDGLLRIDAPVADYYRLIDLGSDAMNEGRHQEALPLLKQALDSTPGDANVHNSYGSALAATGRLAEAIVQYRKATELSPDYPDAHGNLASALVQSGRPDAAIAEFREALELKPAFAEAHAGLGGVLAQQGRVEEAVPHLQKAVLLLPQNIGVRANLCLALLMAHRAAEAVPHAEQLITLSNGQDPLLLDLMGRVYAEANRRPEAIGAIRQALALARQAGDERLTRELEERLASYGEASRR
jgi:Flp pilus assembly protein TadD